MSLRRFLLVLLLCTVFVACAQAQQAAPAAGGVDDQRLRARADAVYALGDSVDGIKQAQALFDYVDYLKDKGDDAKTLHYLTEVLKRRPRALSYQVLCAQLLDKTGKKETAAELAKLIVECAEEDDQQAAARRLLGENVDLSLPPLARVEGEGPAIVIVPIGKADVLLMREIAASFQQRLNVPVLVQDAQIAVPKPKRDHLADFLKETRGRVLAASDDPNMLADLKKQSLTLLDLNDDWKFESFLRNIAPALPGQDGADLVETLDDVRRYRYQYDVDDCLAALRAATATVRRDKVVYVALTKVDLFAEGLNFAYYRGQSGYAVHSYCRFRADATGESPDRSRLKTRMRKACLACLAFTYDIERCSSPKCPLSFQNGLAEQDAQSEEYCPACRKSLEQALGHPINPAP